MTIYVDGKIYKSKDTPIGVRFSPDDIDNVKTMSKNFDTYVAGPKGMNAQMAEIIKVLKPEVCKTSHG